MRKTMLFPLLFSVLGLISCQSGQSASSLEAEETTISDMIGREIKIRPGTYKRVVCIGAGALRMYSYIGDINLLAGVEDIDNESLETRPTLFDKVARPYVLQNADAFKTLPSCGVGGPQAQAAEAEKILSCDPDIVISFYEDADKEEALQKQLGVPVVTLRQGGDGIFSDLTLDSLTLLGKVFGKEKRSQELVYFIQAEIDSLKQATASLSSDKKAYICGLGNWGTTNQFMTAQNYATFESAHISNVVSGLAKDGIQAIDEEKFVSLAPSMDTMIFDAAAIKNIKGTGYDFSLCKAFQTGEVYLQMAYNAYYTNLEISLCNAWFDAKAVYGEELDVDIEAKADEITEMFNGSKLYGKIKECPFSFGGYQRIDNPTEFFK